MTAKLKHAIGRLTAMLGPMLLGVLLVLLWGAVAQARPGGGGSFSGGSRGGGGGGHGGGSGGSDFVIDIIFLLLNLCIDYPKIGLPIVGGIIVVFILAKAIKTDAGKAVLVILAIGGLVALCVFHPRVGLSVAGAVVVLVVIAAIVGSLQKKPPEWSTVIEEAPPARSRVARSPRRELEALREVDPEFSVVVFEDFVDALYTEVQHARASGLERLSPYLKEEARAAIGARRVTAVSDVIVGAMTYNTVERFPNRVRVEMDFEANLTEVAPGGGPQSYYVRERWRLSRKPDARSREPARARTFECPNCGAALDSIRGGTCSYCQQTVDTGEHDWIVDRVQILSRETRGPILTADAPEQGTDLPTIVDEGLPPALAALKAKDPAFSEEELAKRLKLIFETLQVAWSSREWIKARAYLSDRLFQAQLYWIEAYQRAKLRNQNEQTAIERVQLVRVTSDKHFDGITVRLYAQGLDYTVDDAGKVVCGSKSLPRRYSEYWTLLRGAAVRGAPRSDPSCPNCGAPLEVNMTGNCEHCDARVTLGEFDWVLSRIEQDEVYGA
jgi:hypothetical protein